MNLNYAFNRGASRASVIDNMLQQFSTGAVVQNDFGSVYGKENLTLDDNQRLMGLSSIQENILKNSINAATDTKLFTDRMKKAHGELNIDGAESFSLQLDEGAVATQKVATVELNTRPNQQFAAAEAMYPTIKIGYDEQTLEIPIDVAGIGNYNFSGNSYESFEEMTPITSILSDSSFNSGDDLKMVPVYPKDPTNSERTRFVDETEWPTKDVVYDQDDLLNREPHLTNYLKIGKIGNLMNLCRAPGSTKWDNTDEIEASSIKVQSLLFKIKTAKGEGLYKLDTSRFSGNAMRAQTGLLAKSKRGLTLLTNGESVESFKDKDGVACDLFDALGDIKAFLQFTLTATYHRDTRVMEITTSPHVTISHVIQDDVRLKVGTPKVPDDVAALIAGLDLEASIYGIEFKMNHNNLNRSRYGTTIYYSNTTKPYSINRRSPISVKYPMDTKDTNSEIIDKCVKQINTVITRNMSHDAIRAAEAHFERLIPMDGQKVVSANDESSNILPGQHFLRTVAYLGHLNISKETSTRDSKDALANVRAVLVNRVYDAITAIRIRSDFSALKEVDGRKEKYTVVAHAALAPFMFSQGDTRTFGQGIEFDIVETNIDSQKGNIWIFPESQTKDGNIDVFGGFGFCLSRELVVIEGDVRMDEHQYRMMITQPAYEHHDTGCVIGKVVVEDIEDLLGNEGMLTNINRLLVSGEITVDGSGSGETGKEVDIDKVP